MSAVPSTFLMLVGMAAQAPGVEVGLRGVVPVGQKPAVVVRAQQPVVNAWVVLKRSDGREVKLQTGRLKPGQEKALTMDQPEGVFHYEGTLSARYAGAEEEQSMPLSFDGVVLPPPVLSVAPEDVHLEDHRAEVTLSRPARRVTFTVWGDDGTVVDRGDASYKDAPAGEKLPVVWQVTDAKVLRIDIIGHDQHGYFSPTLSLFPWSLEIPHEDVNFPTGQSVIPPAELPKVQAAVGEIQQACRRYGKVVKIRLFVAGHTDTVGSPESNRTLSEARAQSIARAFRKGGISVPILYRGFGEDSPLVVTPDDTDEPRNRRAAYILSVEEPAVTGGTGPWRPL
ncbi:MAG: OmpA family protein [Deltaproteobacteria bacterium]|nr:OmpA family protein [Deltaproteobacteria bacterium]